MIQLERSYKTQSMTQLSADFKKFQGTVYTCEKKWRLGGQQAILLMNEDSGPQTT
jgi:hypothetical protein